MKISCQSCQAKYTIADEKVLGKIVKIRCKKCGATIVINGNEQEAATAAFDASAPQPGNAVYDYTAQGGGESWTVNVSDGDQRTMTTAEIADAYSQSVVNDETYCWKDGMGDWLPLREIPELYGAATAGPQPSMHADGAYSQPPPAQAEDQPTQAGFSSLFGGGGGADAGASLFGGGAAAAAPAAVASAPAARRAGGRAAGGADLFGSAATAGSEQDMMGSAAAQGGAGGSMTGQRNENSVLFSLSALTANVPKEEAPMAQGDGSGLIDIRALSAGMHGKDNGPQKVDDIMNLGGGGAFSAALAAPVLAPAPADMSELNATGGERKKGNAGLIIGMIAGLAIFGLLVGGGIIYALKAPPAVPTATTATATATASPTDTDTAATGTATATAPTTSVATADTDTAKPPGVGTTTGTAKPPTTGGTSTHTATTAVVPTTTAAATGGGKCGCAPSDLECAMKCGSGGTTTAPTATSNAGSGAAFDRGAAASTLGAVASSLGSCKKPNGPTGPGKVKVTFQPSGQVSAVEFVEGSYAGTAVGGCILAKFRGAHIPPFGGSAVPANKSFVIN